MLPVGDGGFYLGSCCSVKFPPIPSISVEDTEYNRKTHDVGFSSLNRCTQCHLRHPQRFKPSAQFANRLQGFRPSAVWHECWRPSKTPTASAMPLNTYKQALNPAQRVGFNSWIKMLTYKWFHVYYMSECPLQ